jgi:ubiquinone/menaquinone biosynthesis C-methylase UbiE
MPGNTNYNTIAWFYDGLSKLVFGSTIKKAQIDLLPHIPANSKVLIVGGGTGWILEEISKLHPSGLEITYIDSSSKMLERSKKRNCGSNKVQFIEASIEQYLLPDTGHLYDVIITPFIADGFSQSAWQQVFTKLDVSLKVNGIWLYADFQLNDKSPLWQRLMIKLLYLFFRITCRLRVKELPLVDECFSFYKQVSKQMYFAGFIVSQVFRK